jgi:hypothetical protein
VTLIKEGIFCMEVSTQGYSLKERKTNSARLNVVTGNVEKKYGTGRQRFS